MCGFINTVLISYIMCGKEYLLVNAIIIPYTRWYMIALCIVHITKIHITKLHTTNQVIIGICVIIIPYTRWKIDCTQYCSYN